MKIIFSILLFLNFYAFHCQENVATGELKPNHTVKVVPIYSNSINQFQKSTYFTGFDFQEHSFRSQNITVLRNLNSTKKFNLINGALFQIKDSNFSLQIMPLFNFSGGKQIKGDTLNATLFQNSRGIHIFGTIKNNFSFESGIMENQARFSTWETNYYKSLGESYPSIINDTLKLTQINAMIPGGARTKPFKISAFDYAYAWGKFDLKLFRFLTISAGNSQQFIGAGFRSLLLSDNAPMSPFLRFESTISKKWSYKFQLNKYTIPIRRLYTSGAEALYQRKDASFHYLTFQPNSKLSVSFFDRVEQLRENEFRTTALDWATILPLPLAGALSRHNQRLFNSNIGINIDFHLHKSILIYSQFLKHGTKLTGTTIQIGSRFKTQIRKFKLSTLIELNYQNSPQSVFILNTHYNVPIGLLQIGNYSEIIFREQITFKKWYAIAHASYYIHNEKSRKYNLQGELGYMWNLDYVASVFVKATIRQTINNYDNFGSGTYLQFGVKTAIFNQNNEF